MRIRSKQARAVLIDAPFGASRRLTALAAMLWLLLALALAPALTHAASARGVPDFTSVVDRYGPAVVDIAVARPPQRASAQQLPDGLKQWLSENGLELKASRSPQYGLGSGFVIDPDGVVLTNAHVVAGAADITVKLGDDTAYQARLIGIDAPTDIAVLKIDAHGLPTVRFGKPASLRVGEWVLAIGAPFGFENSVTAGVVSAKARALPGDALTPFIQTDVAVNPGNSGGPLFNLAGEVVGINSQIYSHSGGYEGVSFAIPIDVALDVVAQLRSQGQVTRGHLGLAAQDLTPALAASFNLGTQRGALINDVQPDGPAQQAGVRVGDVIVALDGAPVRHALDLPQRVAALRPGSTVALDVRRGEQRLQLKAVVAQSQASEDASASPGPLDAIGLAVRPLSRAERATLNLTGGLRVEDVDGPAAAAGLETGDVLLAVNGAAVGSTEQLRATLQDAGKVLALLIQRGEQRLYVPVSSNPATVISRDD